MGAISIFSRFVGHGLDPYFLDTQFRMHPQIAAFSSQEFYHGKLQTGISETDRPKPKGFPWPHKSAGVAFINVQGPEAKDGESRCNWNEIEALTGVLANLLRAKELSVLDVGVVSPYSAQVRALRGHLRVELPKLLKGAGANLTGGLTGKRSNYALEIASVDAYQGREKELIIFSAVRSNEYGNLGFLSDWRRLNVMLTRARRGIIVIGDSETLRTDATWARWINCPPRQALHQALS